MQSAEDPHVSYMLSALASRMAQSIGLHRRLDGYGIPPAEVEQRKNVFWMAFLLEKGISLRSGRPGVFHDEDIGVPLPMQPGSFAMFPKMATLALLESRVYSKLYSARSQTRPDLERLKWVGQLDLELQQWRDSIPIGSRPEENKIICPDEDLIHTIMMHFEYYNCLVTIHRGSVHHGSWLSKGGATTLRTSGDRNINPRVFESASICLGAARNTIKLLKYYEAEGRNDLPNLSLITSVLFLTLYYPLSLTIH